MEPDEHDVFDDSVDPYDRSIDLEYDDGIADSSGDEFEEADDADWDEKWEDEPIPHATQSDEMSDYDDLED